MLSEGQLDASTVVRVRRSGHQPRADQPIDHRAGGWRAGTQCLGHGNEGYRCLRADDMQRGKRLLRLCLCEGARQHRVDLVGLYEKAVVAPQRVDDLQADAEQAGELGLLVQWIEAVGVHPDDRRTSPHPA